MANPTAERVGLRAYMHRFRGGRAASLAAAMATLGLGCHDPPRASADDLADGGPDELSLPAPEIDGVTSLEKAISRRRSQREFAPGSLSPEQIGQLLWAAQGTTDESRALRTRSRWGVTSPAQLRGRVSRAYSAADPSPCC